MFERFTKSARGVVKGAVVQAQQAGADSVTEEHMLLALLGQDGTRSSVALTSLGVAGQREAVARSLADVRRLGGMSKADQEALAGIGIDVTEIVSKVEETHGQGALQSGRGARRGLRTGHRPFTPQAKAVLEKSLRVALGRGDRQIGDEHLLLALTVQPGAVADVLTEYGATYGAVEQALSGGSGGSGAAGTG
ncbi:peptidase [Streptomyces agglomeratus]|uniref:Peptidase n=1 Tax=Streptomyces agglomeratus TaxID=285458 RepID=A0A1E5P683_9ACTN|nr:Clp protease N-terminal domain-containing protein [Streptomyces agglomeratus]OEJ25063.1 peptidase [Streptomyces agglomeratus]OEJ40912.1 peptidase [Streptomyces agglomeratus]OEJ44710.1 peptidase [Streptomyces agglomeratus]OEJ53448.1 peptidase [Streptomyces agglomeratus]OEJ60788.1 peptidase [Streptomyces agglomeratus]